MLRGVARLSAHASAPRFLNAPRVQSVRRGRAMAAESSAAAPKPREQPAGLEAASALFTELTAIPSFTRGVLFGAPTELQLLLTTLQRDLETNAQRSFLQTVPVSAPQHAPAFGFELRGAALVLPSPSGRRKLVVRNPAPGSELLLLELWGGGRLLREVEVPPAVHGGVYADGWFEGAAWSADESRVAYVAEAPPPVRTPQWGGRTRAGGDAPAGWRGQGEHVDDWGEQLTGKRCAALFVVDVPSGAVHAVPGTPPRSSCGQVVWSPHDTHLVFVAWSEASPQFGSQRRLGMIYCFNRPCAVYAVAAPGAGPVAAPGAAPVVAPGATLVTAPGAGGDAPAAVCLTPALQSAFSPRFSPNGGSLAVLSADAAVTSGAHNACAALHVLPWAADGSAGAPRCAVPVVAQPSSAGAFPGLFTAAPLARAPWVSDTQLVMCSTWGSGDALLQLDVSTGEVVRITPPLADAGHWALLDARHGVCAAVVSTPAAPPCLAVASAPDWAWRRMTPAAPEPFSPGAEAVLAALEWRMVDVPVPGVEAFLLRRTAAPGATLPPVVLVPHGGPHSACVAGFALSLAFLAAHGYAVLQVNYRGSIGAGQAPLESLLGRAGRQDVDDCLATLDAAVSAGLVDGGRAAVVGGSHGGFLAAHLIGQAPTRFACAALRNPVTDVATMAGVTDIPDWCFVESAGLGGAAYTEVPSAEALAAMRAVSPMAHVDAVRVPVLMLLGAKDRRVPSSNGMAYAHALRHRGVTVRTLLFPEDEHALSKPRTELESFLNVLDFLQLYVPKD